MKKILLLILMLLASATAMADSTFVPSQASEIATDTSAFNGTCSGSDDTVQKCLDKLDDAVGGTGAATTNHYVTTQAEANLSAEFNLGSLTTGLLKHTVAAGVSTPATATAGTDYYAPGSTDVAVADGGTGGSDAATARTNLGLVIGTNVEAWDADLDSWAGVTRASGFDTWVATPSSANLATLLTGETGSGAAVFGTSPGFTTAANPVSDDGAALGTTALKWSDLFLASGSVINWNNGDLTLTHASNLLTLAGGDLEVPTEVYDATGWNGDNSVPTKDAVRDKIETLGAGSDTNAEKEYWWPASAMLPLEAGDSIPPITKVAGTNVDVLSVSFDDSTDECRTAHFKVPSDVNTSGTSATFRIVWFSQTATTGNVIWDARYQSTGAGGESFDQTLTTKASSAAAVAGTVKQRTVTTWTETFTNLGWVANDDIEIVFCRDANNASDTLVGDAEVIGVGVEMPRA